jgi:thiamine biosynthesis lipoprotein
VLAALGEIRALGRRPDGGLWQVGLPNGATIALDGAVATSSPDGTRFSPTAHHLFDPATGRSSVNAREISVTAPTATLADGASTALAVLPRAREAEMLRALPGVRVVEEGV